MQAAQWGWLHAKPEKHNDTRLQMLGKAVGIEAGIEGEYLLNALFTVGPSQWRGREESAVEWSELLAYGKATRAVSEAWEYEAVMAMSRAYLQAKREGKDIHAMAPVDREDA